MCRIQSRRSLQTTGLLKLIMKGTMHIHNTQCRSRSQGPGFTGSGLGPIDTAKEGLYLRPQTSQTLVSSDRLGFGPLGFSDVLYLDPSGKRVEEAVSTSPHRRGGGLVLYKGLLPRLRPTRPTTYSFRVTDFGGEGSDQEKANSQTPNKTNEAKTCQFLTPTKRGSNPQ